MPRDVRLYLDDMLEAITKIRDYTSGMDYDVFTSDPKTQDAVVRNLEIVGEAAGRLPENPVLQPLKSNGVKSLPSATFWLMSILG